ncbi:type I-MYXAN CRISPR-associated protein Cmx8 (plasmid) [Microcystis aeruginosa FACHB-524]|uniref:type I-MYXAN CRISPR-associated protein Cmx8 n=1 Tax=Microcystis aeruginosa TaxID=1126 RepID=UPI000F45EA5A|nr:type I-MYXAN CRISPR-associated protein Cmx8 [Microcystis aeruginosa]ROI01697.1 type I-MYXAN CRISPR-associated protein Cmx8 [Microcystis aeruginosa FACHB-524]
MAKTTRKQIATVDVLNLDYQLAELPSSQHRAGLAGLVLIIRWLEGQREFTEKVENGAICKLTRLDDKGATLELNQTGLEYLFDEIYDASLEEQERNQLLKKRTKEVIQPLREEEKEETDPKTNKTKTKKVYIYPVVVPKGSFLSDPSYDKSSDGKNGLWIKLWRDMVWSILRGVPATRKPFEARAEGQYNDDAIKVWQQLIQPEEFTVDLPSTYFLGAQANNAENIPFKDRARLQFLLHFWLFAAQIYVPEVIDNEGKRNFAGYAIAIPDIFKLKRFCERLSRLLSERSIEKSGYLPRDCIVDLAIESALDIMMRLTERLTQSTGEQKTASTVLGIDVIHTEKQGNNIRILGASRLNPENLMINEYIRIRNQYWSPLFRKQRLLNLVNHSPWYSGFDSLLCTIPYKQITENEYFKHDVREALNNEESAMTEQTETKMEPNIEELVFELVKNYVKRKFYSKYELTWSNVKGNPKEEKEYNEKKEKIAKSAFLDVRSRTEKMDFINYFVSSLCSVPQHMKSEDYVSLTKALYEDTERIRTLTLLALSANS